MTKPTLRQTDDGSWYLGDHLLHPAEDPLGSAANDLGSLIKDTGPEDVLVIAGVGKGWHVRVMLDLPKPPRIILYKPDEPEAEPVSGLETAHTAQELVELLSKKLVYKSADRVAIFAPPAYVKVWPELVREAMAVLNQTLSRARTNAQTREMKTGLWMEHLAENMVLAPGLPDVSLLAGAFSGVPALVIGAGPSLDESLADLAGSQEKTLVLAAASALGPLAKIGMSPHVALALEAKDESRQFQDADMAKTFFAAASSSHPNHFKKWTGPLGMFHLQPFAASLSGLGQAVPNGGHVTSAAFSLAILWGCDPIILVGQDLAYTGGRTHAAGRSGADEDLPDMLSVPAIDGTLAETSAVMLSYILWYEEAAGALKNTSRRVINATASGAFIPGFENRPLAETVSSLPKIEHDFSTLPEILSQLPKPSASSIIQRLAVARKETEKCLELVQTKGVADAAREARANFPAAAFLENIGPDQKNEAMNSLKSGLNALESMREKLYAGMSAE